MGRRIAFAIGTMAFVAAIAIAGWLGFKLIRNLSKVSNGNILGLLSTTKLKGEDVGRVNILLAGNSADDPGHGGGKLTDSIMVVSIDTKNHTAFTLSIPRDLYVHIPGNGYARINTANVYGDAHDFHESGYADGGMGLLSKIIEQNFQLSINYVALVDYTAFRDGVNAVGGIDITVASKDKRGIYDPNIAKADRGPLVLKNGLQHLDGQTALNLARARNDPTPDGRYGYGLPGGDFDRTANQRLMLLALKNKIFSTGILANPVKIGELLDAVGDHVRTDFKTNELRRLYDIGKDIDSAAISSLSLRDPAHNVNLLTRYITPDGQDTLVPEAGVTNYSQIRLFLKKQTTSDPILKEAATVEVLNGSSANGLAKTASDILAAKSINVAGIGNAPSPYAASTLIDNSNGTKPATRALLTKLYKPAIAVSKELSASYDADFILILGANQAASQSTPSDSE